MRGRDQYILWEFILSLALLLLLVALLRPVISGAFSIRVIACLICGFCFSWFLGERLIKPTKYILNLGMVAVSGWLIYSLVNSSLVYKEMILIAIQGIFSLEVLLSFGLSMPEVLSYTQVLSIPLFMSHAVWIRNYNPASTILILGYLFCWLVILKIKFYLYFEPINSSGAKKNYSVYLLAAFLAAGLGISWLLSTNLLLKKSPKEGFLTSEEKGSGGGTEEAEGLNEKNFYDLQDKLVDKITKTIPNLAVKERQEALILSNKLISESPFVLEVREAESGLISEINAPGPGLDPGEQEGLTILIKEYVDKKVSFILKDERDNIVNNLKSNPYGLMNRLDVMNSFKKMQESSSLEDINTNLKELNKVADSTRVGSSVKSELKKSSRRYQEWKVLQLYRKLMGLLEEITAGMDESLKQDIKNLSEKIDMARALSDLQGADQAIKQFQGEPASPDFKSAVKIAKELRNLKAEMLILQKNKEAGDALDKTSLDEEKKGELKESLDEIDKAADSKQLAERVLAIKESIVNEAGKIPPKVEDYLDRKTESLSNRKELEILEMLGGLGLPDFGKELAEEVKKLKSYDKKDKLNSAAEKIKSQAEAIHERGFITGKTEEKLINKVEELRLLLEAKIGVDEINKARDSGQQNKSGRPLKTSEAIDASSLEGAQKELLRDLSEKLSGARTLSQLELLKEGIKKQLEALAKSSGAKKEDLRKLNQGFENDVKIQMKMLIGRLTYPLSKDLENLKKISPEDSSDLEFYLEKIRDADTVPQLRQNSKALEQHFDSKKEELEEAVNSAKDVSGQKISGLPDIFILPERLILTNESSASLKIIAVYQNKLIKEITPEADWLVSGSGVVSIDKSGLVRALSLGEVKIAGEYKGIRSRPIQVKVVDKIAGDTYMEVKKALIQ